MHKWLAQYNMMFAAVYGWETNWSIYIPMLPEYGYVIGKFSDDTIEWWSVLSNTKIILRVKIKYFESGDIGSFIRLVR